MHVTKLYDPGNYYLVKLQTYDPRALVLRHFVNNCQSIGNAAQSSAKEGSRLSDNGFYVYVKAHPNFDPNNINWDDLEKDCHRIIRESSVWISKTNVLVLDFTLNSFFVI